MAHHEQLGTPLLHCLSVKLQCSLVKPLRSGFQVVFEGKPEVRELLNLPIIRPTQIYYVGYSQGFQLLHLRLALDCASEREPFAHEESFHRLGPVSIPKRPRRLENLYFANAILARIGALY
jgi:hypothetical protein